MDQPHRIKLACGPRILLALNPRVKTRGNQIAAPTGLITDYRSLITDHRTPLPTLADASQMNPRLLQILRRINTHPFFRVGLHRFDTVSVFNPPQLLQ